MLDHLDNADASFRRGNFRIAAATRRAVADRIWQRFLRPEAPARGDLDDMAFLRLTDRTAPLLDSARRDLLAERLRQRFLDEPGSMQRLEPAEATELFWVAKKLGVTWERRSAAAEAWAQDRSRLADAGPGTLAVVLHSLRSSEGTLPLAREIVDTAWRQHLGSDAAWEQTGHAPFRDRVRLARETARHLSGPQRAELLQRITGTLLYDDGALAARTPRQLRQLLDAVERLDMTREEASSILTGWIAASAAWRDSDPWELRSFVATLRRTPGDADSREALRRLADHLYDDFLSDPAFLAGAEAIELEMQTRYVPMALTQPQREGFARVYHRVLLGEDPSNATPSLEELVRLGKLIENAQLMRDASLVEPFAGAVMRALDRGERLEGHPYWQPLFLGTPLQAEADRAALADRLLGADGLPDPAVGRTLAFATREAGEAALTAWQRRLDEAVKASSGGDERALWLLLRSYTRSMAGAKWDYLRGREDLEAALDVAESPAAFLPVASAYAWRLSTAGRGQEAAVNLEERLEGRDLPDDALEALRDVVDEARGRSEARSRGPARGGLAERLAERTVALEAGDNPLQQHVRGVLRQKLEALRSR